MKQSLFAGILGGVLACCGCQTMNPTAKTQSSAETSVAQPERVREVPWTWGKRKPPASPAELPPEFAKKFEDARRRSGGNRTVEECIADGSDRERARDFPSAQKAYEEALILDPANAIAHHRLAILADMRQEFTTAQDHYDAALRQRPNDANVLSDLGYSQFLRKNYQQSQTYLLKALDVDRQHTQALKNLGMLYAGQGRYDDALMAFRHYRSEPEAQELLAKFFPNGKPASSGDVALAGGSRAGRPMPPETSADRDLKAMPPDQVLQLMEQEKQKSIREREQKQLAELRGSLQPSLPADAGAEPAVESPGGPAANVASTDPAGRTPWDQAATTPDSAGTDGVPAWANSPAAEMASSGPPTSNNAFSDTPRATASAAGNEMPFWSGAGVRQPDIAQTSSVEDWPAAANASASGSPQGNAFPPSQTSALATPPTNAAWWDNDAPPQTTAQTSAAVPTAPDAWPYRQPSSNPQSNSGAPQSLSQQAYQLGMSVGPGTMFPAVTGYASNPASTVSPWASSASSNRYTEMKPATGAGGSTNVPDPVQWQNAPTEAGPRSPTDGWDSPTTVPWPGNAAAGSPATGVAAKSSSNGRLPLIQPASFPAANSAAAGSNSRRNSPTSNQNANFESGDAAESELAPDWFNSPPSNRTSQPRSAPAAPQTGTAPQWPYAPR